MISDLRDALLHQDLDEFVKTLPEDKIKPRRNVGEWEASLVHTFIRISRATAKKMGLVELTPWRRGCLALTSNSSSWLPKHLADKHRIPYLLIVDSWED